MAQDQTRQTPMFCRKCGYPLGGLSENRCPECGRLFDPAAPRTFLHHRRGWVVRRWVRRIGLGVASAALLAAIGLGSLWGNIYWEYHADWQAEQKAIAALKATVVDLSAGPVSIGFRPGQVVVSRIPVRQRSGRWLDRFSWPVNHLRARVQNIMVGAGHQVDADFAKFSAFKHVESIDLEGATDDHWHTWET